MCLEATPVHSGCEHRANWRSQGTNRVHVKVCVNFLEGKTNGEYCQTRNTDGYWSIKSGFFHDLSLDSLCPACKNGGLISNGRDALENLTQEVADWQMKTKNSVATKHYENPQTKRAWLASKRLSEQLTNYAKEIEKTSAEKPGLNKTSQQAAGEKKENAFLNKTFQNEYSEKIVYTQSFHNTFTKLPSLQLPAAQIVNTSHFRAVGSPRVSFNIPRRLIEGQLVDGTARNELFDGVVPEPRTAHQIIGKIKEKLRKAIDIEFYESTDNEVDQVVVSYPSSDLYFYGLKENRAHQAFCHHITHLRNEFGLYPFMGIYLQEAFRRFGQALQGRLVHLKALGINEDNLLYKDVLVTLKYVMLGHVYLDGEIVTNADTGGAETVLWGKEKPVQCT